MPVDHSRLRSVVAELSSAGDAPSLRELGARLDRSPGRAQRELRAHLGESPKQFSLRLRLDRAAALLASTEHRVIDIAVHLGFGSHEHFSRTFRQRFGASPVEWRTRHHLTPEAARASFAAAPCVGLFRRTRTTKDHTTRKEPAVAYEFETRQLPTTPVLYQARRVATDEVSAALAECLPAVFGYVVEQGLAMAGPPYVRYVDTSPAFVSIEGGIPLMNPPAPPPSDLGIIAGELPGGPALVTVHGGPYDTLGEAHVALDRHMAEQAMTPAGAPWEVYITDPGDVPDPADWVTEVLWPIE